MNKKTILIVIGIIAAVVGFLVFTQPTEDAGGTPSEHTIGEGSTGVVLIEYGDFQCSACAQYFPVLQQVKEYYGDQIKFQFRHFPLESAHVNARAASRAAEAASMQGKFWEMHDELFANQLQWSTANDPLSIFEGYARNIGVADMNKFTEDYKSSSVNAVINADLQAGRDLKVSATPTFVLNDKVVEPNPPASLQSFVEIIDAAITEKTGQSPTQSTDETTEVQPEAEPQTTQPEDTSTTE